MPATLLSLILSLISAAWGMWGATNPPKVDVVYNATASASLWAAAGPEPNGNCLLTIYKPFAIEAQFSEQQSARTINHEMGHCLGLQHDTLAFDLMNPISTVQVPSWHDLWVYHQLLGYHVAVAEVAP